MTTQTKEIDVLLRGPKLAKAVEKVGKLPTLHGACYHLLYDWAQVRANSKRDLYVVLWRSALLNEGEFAQARKVKTEGAKRFLVLPDDSPWEAFAEVLVRLVQTPERFYAPALLQESVGSFLRRFLTGLCRLDEEMPIADARWEDDTLVVVSPTFERLKVTIEALPPKLRKAKADELREFEIDEDGDYIYWPSQDVHMGWSQFLQAVDPRARLRAEQKSEAFNRKYGKAIQSLRAENGLRQSDIPELDERTVRRIERGETRATLNALEKLAEAHGMTTNEYMNELAKRL